MRYLHLYFTYIKRSIIARLEYKKDTFISIISFFMVNAAAILSISFILNSIPSLDGWTMSEIGFLYGFSMMPVAIDHLFSDDLWTVAYYKVRSGELDRMFLRPIPVLFQVIAETFQLEGLGELFVGIIMLAVCGNLINVSWSFSLVLLLIVATIFGGLIITSLKIIFASLAFIFRRSGPLLQVVYNFISYTRYPLSIYPQFVKVILTFLFPFAVFISFPIETVLYNKYSPYLLILIIILVSIAILALSIVIWWLCSKKYESSGS